MPRLDPPQITKGDRGLPGLGFILSTEPPLVAQDGDVWIDPEEDPENIYVAEVFSASFVFDGGGSVVPVGKLATITIPFNATLTGYRILSPNQVGTVSATVGLASYANYPTFTTISGGNPITLTAAQKNEDLTLTGWSPTITAGDILRVVLTGVTGSTLIDIHLLAQR